MKKVIACCGLNCSGCPAYIATITNNHSLRIKTAEEWKTQYNAGIVPEMINCTGCREAGVKFSHCQQCEIRNCADSKNLKTCAGCENLGNCEPIKKLHQYVPEALENLKSLN